MGAGPSIIHGGDPLAVDYDTMKHQAWGEMEKSKDSPNRGRRHHGKNTIQSLASQQLSTKIQSSRIAQSQSQIHTPDSFAEKDLLYSKSFYVASASKNNSPEAPGVKKGKSTNAIKTSPRSSKRVLSLERGMTALDISKSRIPELSPLVESKEAQLETAITPPSSTRYVASETKSIRKKPNLLISIQDGSSTSVGKDDGRHEAPNARVGLQLQLPQLTLSPTMTGNDEPAEEKDSLMYRRRAKFLRIKSKDDVLVKEEEKTLDHGSSHHIARTDSGEPGNGVRLSPGGSTALVGHWRIKETGLLVSPRGDGESGSHIRDKGSDAYVEIGTLGSGASGTVVEALHLPTLTIVALKVLPVHNPKKNHFLSQELGVLYKNLIELRIVDERGLSDVIVRDQSTPRCRYVLSMYDAFIDTRACKINLVMEMMDGGSLQDLVENGGCRDERVLADIAYQVIRGLQYLHAQKQMHRDIKPGNILLNCQGWIKVADFGISKAMDNTFGCAKSFVGTMCYMAPERITAKNYSFPSDIWSMGLTLLAVSMGRFPLPDTAEGFWGLLHLICDSEPPSPGPNFSADFNDFILHCLKKDPDERWRPEQLLKHRFLSDFQQGHPRRSTFSTESDSSEPASRTSSVVSLDGEMQNCVTLAKLAATKDLSSDEDELYDIRIDHLMHIADVLNTRCKQRELINANALSLSTTFSFEETDSYDEEDANGGGTIIQMTPIRLPALTGRSKSKWRHLADQLHLPVDIVIDRMKDTISARFFSEAE